MSERGEAVELRGQRRAAKLSELQNCISYTKPTTSR